MKETRYIPVPKWAEYHPWPTVSGLRGLINRSDENGIGVAVKKVGKCLLIDEQAFFKWVEDRDKLSKGK